MSLYRHDAMMKITDACADEAEVLALSTIRLVAAGYSTGDVACWDMAYAQTENLLAPAMAGRLVAVITTLIRAIRAERAAEWRFLPATCCRVTPDEQAIIQLIAAVRQGGEPDIERAAIEVIASPVSHRTEAAALEVARILDRDIVQAIAQCRRNTPVRVH